MQDQTKYGINRSFAHPRAITLIPESFFWDCIDELAPFGSDEGDMALAEYRDWRIEHPDIPTIAALKWVIESVGEMELEAYNRELISEQEVIAQGKENYDVWLLDISIIATGFGQLVDEGRIDEENKPIIQVALDRQLLCAELVMKELELCLELLGIATPERM